MRAPIQHTQIQSCSNMIILSLAHHTSSYHYYHTPHTTTTTDEDDEMDLESQLELMGLSSSGSSGVDNQVSTSSGSGSNGSSGSSSSVSIGGNTNHQLFAAPDPDDDIIAKIRMEDLGECSVYIYIYMCVLVL